MFTNLGKFLGVSDIKGKRKFAGSSLHNHAGILPVIDLDFRMLLTGFKAGVTPWHSVCSAHWVEWSYSCNQRCIN